MHLKNIITFNFNSYKPISKLPLSRRIPVFAKYIMENYDASIVCIQEFIIGPGKKWLKELENALGGKYCIYYNPLFDPNEYPRTLATIILIRRKDFFRWEVLKTPCCMPNRVCEMNLWTVDGKFLKVIGLYMIQIQCFKGHKRDRYVAGRIASHHELWEQVIAMVEENVGDTGDTAAENRILPQAVKDQTPIIIMGDLQESSTKGRHIERLNELGFAEAMDDVQTVKGDFFREKRIDHILWNEPALQLIGRAPDEITNHFIVDTTLTDMNMSDHCLLAAI